MSKELFKSYPSVNAFYKTSDGQYFFHEHQAVSHANTLKDNKVSKIEREQPADETPEAPKAPKEPKAAKK